MFRALAIDLDGTLLQPDDSVSAGDARAVRAALDAGLRVIVATARWHGMADRVAEELGIEGPVIACSGAQVRVRGEGVDLFDARLPGAFCEALFAVCDEMRCVATIVGDEEVFVKLEGEPVRRLPGARYVPSLGEAGIGPARIALIQGTEVNARIEEEVVPRFAEGLHVVDSISGRGRRILTLTGAGADKGAALEAACRHLGFGPEEVVAFGDSNNDVSMFRRAGASVAMGQASAAVRAAATWVSAANTEDGVARGIERLLARGRVG